MKLASPSPRPCLASAAARCCSRSRAARFSRKLFRKSPLSNTGAAATPLPLGCCWPFILLFCLLFCLSYNWFSLESPVIRDSRTDPTALFFSFLDLLLVRDTSTPSPIFFTILTSRLELIIVSLSLLSVRAGLQPKEQIMPNSALLENSNGRQKTWFLGIFSFPPTSINRTSTLSLCSFKMTALKYL